MIVSEQIQQKEEGDSFNSEEEQCEISLTMNDSNRKHQLIRNISYRFLTVVQKRAEPYLISYQQLMNSH